MFSLAVVDKLTTGELNGGKFVAGTGTITEDGKVGPIGGITHKMLAAHEAGADDLPGSRGQLRRGTLGARRRPTVDQGRHPHYGRRCVAHGFRWWRTSTLLRSPLASDA